MQRIRSAFLVDLQRINIELALMNVLVLTTFAEKYLVSTFID